jgi:hypothetical protein
VNAREGQLAALPAIRAFLLLLRRARLSGVAAFFTPVTVLVAGTRLLAAALIRNVRAFARTTIGHVSLLLDSLGDRWDGPSIRG